MKTREADSARRLRGERGWSVKRIAAELGVSVSSVGVWVRDVPLTSAQQTALHERIGAGRVRGNIRTTQRARADARPTRKPDAHVRDDR
jgi:transposase-like protein